MCFLCFQHFLLLVRLVEQVLQVEQALYTKISIILDKISINIDISVDISILIWYNIINKKRKKELCCYQYLYNILLNGKNIQSLKNMVLLR